MPFSCQILKSYFPISNKKEVNMGDNKLMNRVKFRTSSPIAKLMVTLVIAAFLLVPASAISNLVRERENRKEDAEISVINQWGGRQHIAGPVLAIPVEKKEIEYVDGKDVIRLSRKFLYILPDDLKVDGILESHTREKGIFEIELYKGNFSIEGNFGKNIDEVWKAVRGEVLWKEARIILGLGDIKGLSQSVDLDWNGEKSDFQGGTSGASIFPAGISASVPFSGSEKNVFKISVNLKGGGALTFFPLGRETSVSVSSDWISPEFSGSFIPTERDIDKNGFTAQWNVGALARNYPQSWMENNYDWNYIYDSGFGVDFITPVDSYYMSHRAMKYCFLFIFLPFIILFLFEVLTMKKLHPLQYIMIGLSVCMFFLLLISISEHTAFFPAYMASAGASAALVSFYTGTVLRSALKGAVMAFLNILLYLYLYMALASEDMALLIGSLGLFVILAVIMLLTRKINWYEIGTGNRNC